MSRTKALEKVKLTSFDDLFGGSHGMSIEPFELFQTNEQILVLQKIQEIELIQESRLLPAEYQEILFEFL